MSYTHAVAGSVGWLTMDRPAAMNSLSSEMVAGIAAKLHEWRDDPAVRVVVITGNGRAFCAGADLKESSADRQGYLARRTSLTALSISSTQYVPSRSR